MLKVWRLLKKERRLLAEPPLNFSTGNEPLEDVHIIFVADETHFLDVRLLGDGEHLVDHLVPRRCIGLEVKFRNWVHLLRRIEILPQLSLRKGLHIPQYLISLIEAV